MAHEMVHAWDHLKWKVDAGNLRHQACLEVRTPSHHLIPQTPLTTPADTRIHPQRRMPFHARILHPQPMEHHRAATGVRSPTSRVINDGEADDQG